MRKLFSLLAVLALVAGVAFVAPAKTQAFGPGDNPSFDICNVLPWLPFCEDEEEPVDVCENIEGIQEETPEGYINEEGTCTPEEPPVDYCETLEGIQAEDEDCPAPEEEVPPVEIPCTENCGNPPTFAGSSTGAPVCS